MPPLGKASIIAGMYRLVTVLCLLVISPLFAASSIQAESGNERVRTFTRPIEFEFGSWTFDAVSLKLQQAVLGIDRYLPAQDQSDLVREYISLVSHIQGREGQLAYLHSNPDAASVQIEIEQTEAELDAMYARRSHIAPIAENILQAQVASVLRDEQLTSAGQPLPPLLFHSTPLPWALIVSPRSSISQLANVSLETELTLDAHIALEDKVAAALNVSTLVVPVGGVGTYPTMVAQTSSLNWLCEVISHEWTHNYLTWHPLGALYFESPELTTMNETTANIVGKEVGAIVIERYYPELAPPPPQPVGESASEPAAEPEAPAAPVFDYRAEMHQTRLHVDELLAAGKIEEAENFMEQRRLFFWDHGYAIRKLNQAYFAFYGSYADTPTGPAGADPVGAAVRELRQRSATLEIFIDRMASLTSFAQLQALLASLS